jgi:hypothetical protein
MPHTSIKDASEVATRPFMYLGEVIQWIACRGAEMSSEEIANKWDIAERELFDLLATGAIAAQGFLAPYSIQVYEDLPSGIWTMMNKGQSNLTFSPLDDSIQRHDGGSINVGPNRWDGVRLPTAFVLKTWSASSDKLSRFEQGNVPNHKELWQLGADWLNSKIRDWRDGASHRLTRVEAEKRLRAELGIKSDMARKIWTASIPPEWQKPGPRS